MANIDSEPLPFSMRRHLKQGAVNTHPGLALDKYACSWNPSLHPEDLSKRVQEPTIRNIVKLSQQEPSGLKFAELKQRHTSAIDSLPSSSWVSATTIGPMTLHLARASALENAGICLHSMYGFVYLPGSGVKGMSRAWAETVWLPTQSDPHKAWEQIEDIFGWAPNKDRRDQLKEDSHPAHRRFRDGKHKDKDELKESAGGVIFHDAWPQSWPKLQQDILNSHHSAYYGSDNNKNPPGDWENPIPVYFLAVASETTFEFAVTGRTERVPSELLQLAEQFVVGALMHNGAGAKTAAGYGAFRITKSSQQQNAEASWGVAKDQQRRESFECELELVTPLFYPALIREDPSGCVLRPATLRGVLRAWWRTMHASWLDVATLRRLEAALWGDTNTSGAIRVTIEASPNNPGPLPFDRRAIIRGNKLPEPPNKKTTQGLIYHSFGMDDKRDGRIVRRYFAPPGSKWTIRISVRPALLRTGRKEHGGKKDETQRIDDVQGILLQAQSAVWLLTQFGGVGSKSRRGFGSLTCPTTLPVQQLAHVEASASQFRDRVKLKVQKSSPDSPSIAEVIPTVDIPTPWANYWFALDRVAHAAQAFAQSYKHNPEKKALGLPRNVRQPFSGRFTLQKNSPVKDRHSSPVLYSFGKDANGSLIARVVAFPSAQLPDLATSRSFLQTAMSAITTNIQQEVTTHGSSGQRKAADPPKGGPTPPPSSSGFPKSGERVTAVMLEEKTKKGGWMAKHAPTELSGPIQNPADVPGDVQVGTEVQLIVALCNGRQIAFRWPTAADDAKAQKPKSSGKGGGQRGKGRSR